MQDRAGYLWLGTNEGLVRFDGVGFLVMPRVRGTAPAGRQRAGLVARPGWGSVDRLRGHRQREPGGRRAAAQLLQQRWPARVEHPGGGRGPHGHGVGGQPARPLPARRRALAGRAGFGRGCRRNVCRRSPRTRAATSGWAPTPALSGVAPAPASSCSCRRWRRWMSPRTGAASCGAWAAADSRGSTSGWCAPTWWARASTTTATARCGWVRSGAACCIWTCRGRNRSCTATAGETALTSDLVRAVRRTARATSGSARRAGSIACPKRWCRCSNSARRWRQVRAVSSHERRRAVDRPPAWVSYRLGGGATRTYGEGDGLPAASVRALHHDPRERAVGGDDTRRRPAVGARLRTLAVGAALEPGHGDDHRRTR